MDPAATLTAGTSGSANPAVVELPTRIQRFEVPVSRTQRVEVPMCRAQPRRHSDMASVERSARSLGALDLSCATSTAAGELAHFRSPSQRRSIVPSTSTTTTIEPPDASMELKGKKYNEMMERFQIRRLSRAHSGASSMEHSDPAPPRSAHESSDGGWTEPAVSAKVHPSGTAVIQSLVAFARRSPSRRSSVSRSQGDPEPPESARDGNSNSYHHSRANSISMATTASMHGGGGGGGEGALSRAHSYRISTATAVVDGHISEEGGVTSNLDRDHHHGHDHATVEELCLTPRSVGIKAMTGLRATGQRSSLRRTLVTSRRRLLRWWRVRRHRWQQPIAPTSRFVQVRAGILLVMFAFHAVYYPYSTAFLSDHHVATVDVSLIHTIELVFELLLIGDIVLMFNTAYENSRGVVVTSRAAIARRYMQGWFALDLVSSIPVDMLTLLVHQPSPVNGDLVNQRQPWHFLVYDVCVRNMRAVHVLRVARVLWTPRLTAAGSNVFVWLLYSRYSHLVRIIWIVLFIVLIAHYLACALRLLTPDSPGDAVTLYVARIYDALQLMQGQGIVTTTMAQNLFGAAAVLMGSIALAILFGHVAILVSNFSANATNFQRKLEVVFAIMTKLRLPAPLRERIHQYYDHLWREYESLDGEIAKFTKELSHTLELEVVLCKYMELVMNVTFWSDSSPDFQKQLVLHLQVRVYLPDDYIMRRGEVDDEFYMINRGACELECGSDSVENSTVPPLHTSPEDTGDGNEGEDEATEGEGTTRTDRSRDPYALSQSSRERSTDKLPLPGRGSSVDSSRNKKWMKTTTTAVQQLTRGQCFGELALLMNYERSANVRALTYVEVCVLKRTDFQSILVRHPLDRKRVIHAMLRKTMEHNEANRVHCPLKATVQAVFGSRPADDISGGGGGEISAVHAALLISSAVNVPIADDSIRCGVNSNLREQLIALRDQDRQQEQQMQQQQQSPVDGSARGPPTNGSTSGDMPRIKSPDRFRAHQEVAREGDPVTQQLLQDLQREMKQLRMENRELLRAVGALATKVATIGSSQLAMSFNAAVGPSLSAGTMATVAEAETQPTRSQPRERLPLRGPASRMSQLLRARSSSMSNVMLHASQRFHGRAVGSCQELHHPEKETCTACERYLQPGWERDSGYNHTQVNGSNGSSDAMVGNTLRNARPRPRPGVTPHAPGASLPIKPVAVGAIAQRRSSFIRVRSRTDSSLVTGAPRRADMKHGRRNTSHGPHPGHTNDEPARGGTSRIVRDHARSHKGHALLRRRSSHTSFLSPLLALMSTTSSASASTTSSASASTTSPTSATSSTPFADQLFDGRTASFHAANVNVNADSANTEESSPA